MSDLDKEARAIVRLGMTALTIGLLFWVAVIVGIVALIIHFV